MQKGSSATDCVADITDVTDSVRWNKEEGSSATDCVADVTDVTDSVRWRSEEGRRKKEEEATNSFFELFNRSDR